MTAVKNPSPGFARNPEKQIDVEPFARTVVVTSNGAVVAASSCAKVLQEAPYPPALYIPFEDIRFEQLEKSEKSTHCPYKGDCIPTAVR